MPDWKQYIRDNLPPLALGAERELEIADEMSHTRAQSSASRSDDRVEI